MSCQLNSTKIFDIYLIHFLNVSNVLYMLRLLTLI